MHSDPVKPVIPVLGICKFSHLDPGVHDACARLCGFSILEHVQFIRQQCVGSTLQQFLPERPSAKLQNQHKEHLQHK